MGLSKFSWVSGMATVFLQLVTGSFGWGQHGHYVTCKIAEGYLTENAMAVVKELLPKSAEGELAAVCSWADLFAVRSHYYWSRALHFVDTPDFRCNYDYARDCHDSSGRKNRCVTGATYNYTLQLMSACQNSASKSRYNLTEALMFLSHFVGDVHQPLHCGFLGDLGGNRIHLHWYRRKANLHHVWDTEIIDTALKRFYGSDLNIMIESMQKNITEDWYNYVESWEECDANCTVCPNSYASESVKLACKYAYRNATPGSVLGDEYFLTRLPIVERRLAQGGIRLAATLNRIFNSSCGLISNAGKGEQGVSFA
ncbi:endonuclease 4-like [Chenopodium quinoa]|uniref:endonuclease 4-like n=1 Tax=Chenopodium quinoa TaxID=63459 RepID=UPI000B781176|nr:endonuclease 4-like [Chenopodium quinoa]